MLVEYEVLIVLGVHGARHKVILGYCADRRRERVGLRGGAARARGAGPRHVRGLLVNIGSGKGVRRNIEENFGDVAAVQLCTGAQPTMWWPSANGAGVGVAAEAAAGRTRDSAGGGQACVWAGRHASWGNGLRVRPRVWPRSWTSASFAPPGVVRELGCSLRTTNVMARGGARTGKVDRWRTLAKKGRCSRAHCYNEPQLGRARSCRTLPKFREALTMRLEGGAGVTCPEVSLPDSSTNFVSDPQGGGRFRDLAGGPFCGRRPPLPEAAVSRVRPQVFRNT
jgi:hypothetical protein